MLVTLALFIRRALFLAWLAIGLYAFCWVAAALAFGLVMAGNEGSPIIAAIAIGLTVLVALCWWKLGKWLGRKVG